MKTNSFIFPRFVPHMYLHNFFFYKHACLKYISLCTSSISASNNINRLKLIETLVSTEHRVVAESVSGAMSEEMCDIDMFYVHNKSYCVSL